MNGTTRNGHARLTITTSGEPDKYGKRLVIGRVGDAEIHRDTLDTNSDYHRQRFATAIYGKLPLHLASVTSESTLADEVLAAASSPTGGEKLSVSYSRLTSAELASGDYRLEYLVDGILAARQPAILGGPKKSLKTSLAVDLAMSIATATPFLGEFPAHAARVLMMSGESGLATLQETAHRIAVAKGLHLADVASLVWSTDLPRLDSVAHRLALGDMLRGDEIGVLILDPAYLTMPGGDAGNLFVVGDMLRALADVCNENGVTLVLCHHARKGVANPHDPPELEDIAWSGFQEFARQWLLLGRREKYTPGTGQHRLWLSVGGSAGHGGLWGLDIDEGTGHGNRRWSVSLHRPDDVWQAASEARQQEADQRRAERDAERLQQDCRTTCNMLATMPDRKATFTELRRLTGLSGPRFQAAYARLLADKAIEPVTLTRGNNRTYDGCTLAIEP